MLWWIIIAVVVLFLALTFGYYNKFVRLSHQIENSLSQITVQLKKRSDLVPNLVNTVKGYAKHEKKVFKQVTDARKELVSARGVEKKMKAGNQLQEALKSVFAIAEGYPELKANENFLHLQQELSAIEDKIAYARQYYNDGIMSYNVSVQTVPGVVFARMFGFKAKQYFKIPEPEKAVPKINFD